MLRTHSPNTRLTPKIRVYGLQALPSADAAGHADVPSTTRRLRFSDAASQSAI
jgi:hypothetical protein